MNPISKLVIFTATFYFLLGAVSLLISLIEVATFADVAFLGSIVTLIFGLPLILAQLGNDKLDRTQIYATRASGASFLMDVYYTHPIPETRKNTPTVSGIRPQQHLEKTARWWSLGSFGTAMIIASLTMLISLYVR